MPDTQLAADLEIDRVAHRFEQALRRGDVVSIEELAAQHPSLGQRLIRELVQVEIEFRKSRQLPVERNDYAARFPELDLQANVGDTSHNAAHDSIVSPPEPAAEEPAPTPLNLHDYVLETKLGGGGQGDVYLARQLSLGRRVAVKLLTKNAARDPQSEHRFLREARTLAQTHHPQIVTIHGLGRTPEGELFLVMEYLAGKDLAKQIAERAFDIRRAVEVALQIARAVEHAHARGVIHRDLKPSNVLWDDVRGPVVTDFGLAKDLRAEDGLTHTEQMMGTPTYMAPEQAHRRFGDISLRTDVYGLAGTLYALLTGHSPIAPGPLAEVLQRLTSDDPISDPRDWRPEIPAALAGICLKGLAKRPSDRYASIADLSRDLQRWFTNADVSDLELPPTVVTPPAVTKTDRLEPGGQFGRYKLIAALSADFTRKVFRAEDEAGRLILLKCLPPAWMSDRVRRSQFRQEVVLSCGLTHPCLAKVVEAGVQNGAEFLALEFIEGESLAQILLRDGPFEESKAVELLQPIAEVLHEIHAAGVIYRDLRPQNILLTPDGRTMLAEVRFSDELSPDDNVTMAGWGNVTSKFIAPELLLGKASDVASEVYTLGATLYALVTGRDPYAGEQNAINLLIAKKASKYADPQTLVPDLGDAVCKLIADAMNANLSARPESAQAFAERLKECRRQSYPHLPAPPDSDNLLHTVWDQLDPELQDAFSLAYNKKRRTGSNRISTRDLFEAMARLGTGPLRDVFNELPAGALPDPVAADIPVDMVVLKEQPLLSDCVEESLGEFRKFDGDQQKKKKVSPVDLFVDIAKHGHGSSVVQLREHGVDPDALERIVKRLGLRVLRREASNENNEDNDEKFLCDDNVQFTVYRPKVIPPEMWQPLLAFAHLADLPADAPAGTPDPVAEVQRQAEQVLGTKLSGFQSLLADSAQPIPRSSELTFVPTGDGLEFNPPQRSFRWNEPVHREEFRFKAAARLDGQIARGRLSVYLGRLLIAEVGIVTRVDRQASAKSEPVLSGENRAYRFRRIYACVARADRAVLSEFQHYAQLLRDTFLSSQFADDSKPSDPQQLIRSADVFQLFWSRSAMNSAETEREWRYALSLKRTDFIRSLYWEEPFPADPARSLPPPELLALGFQKVPLRTTETPLIFTKRSRSARKAAPKKSVSVKLERIRAPRVDISYRTEAYLELLNGSHIGKILRLSKDRVILGRKSDADLPLESNTVHRYHAQLVCDQHAWWVEDLQSRNGTFVNGVRAEGRVRLNDGDRIHVGDVLIGFRAETISEPAAGGLSAAIEGTTLSPPSAPAVQIPADDEFELSLGAAEDAIAFDSSEDEDGVAFERVLDDADDAEEFPQSSSGLSQEIFSLPTAEQQAELLQELNESADSLSTERAAQPDRRPPQSAAPSHTGLFRTGAAYPASEAPRATSSSLRWIAAAILGLALAGVLWWLFAK